MSPLPLSTWHLQPFRSLHTEKGGTELKEDREKAKFKQRPQTRELTAFVSLSVCVCSCVLWWCAHTHISITASRKCCLIEGSWAVMRASSTRTHMHTQRFCKLKNKRRKTHYKSSPFHSLSLLHPLCVFGSFFFSSSFFFSALLLTVTENRLLLLRQKLVTETKASAQDQKKHHNLFLSRLAGNMSTTLWSSSGSDNNDKSGGWSRARSRSHKEMERQSETKGVRRRKLKRTEKTAGELGRGRRHTGVQLNKNID